jgi:hypothetical protein
VRRDGFSDPGAAREAVDDPPGTVTVQPPPVRGQEHRPASALADGQIDRPGRARRQRYGDDLAERQVGVRERTAAMLERALDAALQESGVGLDKMAWACAVAPPQHHVARPEPQEITAGDG